MGTGGLGLYHHHDIHIGEIKVILATTMEEIYTIVKYIVV